LENAAKALMIAGSVLIAVMIISMLFYFLNSMKQVPIEQAKELQQEQIAKFNAEYESYDKPMMYGQDVVTVINKAINNDRQYATDQLSYNNNNQEIAKENNFYLIDVQVTLTTPIKSYATQYYEVPGGVDGTSKYVDSTTYPTNGATSQTISGYVNGNTGNLQTYQLGTIWDANKPFNIIADNGESVTISGKVEDFFTKGSNVGTAKIQLVSPVAAKPLDEFNYTIVDNGFTDFKRKFFQCTEIGYDTTTGRVNKLTFVETKAPNDTNLN